MSFLWYGLIDHEVIGPFDTIDQWYHSHAGPDWRGRVGRETGVDPWRVDLTVLPDGREVSTVFLGLDHQYVPGGRPLLFETLVLPEGELMFRCSTWDEAVEMHAAVLAELGVTP